jgi:hypothetical protein
MLRFISQSHQNIAVHITDHLLEKYFQNSNFFRWANFRAKSSGPTNLTACALLAQRLCAPIFASVLQFPTCIGHGAHLLRRSLSSSLVRLDGKLNRRGGDTLHKLVVRSVLGAVS